MKKIETVINNSKISDPVVVIVSDFVIDLLSTAMYMFLGPEFMTEQAFVRTSPGGLQGNTIGF